MEDLLGVSRQWNGRLWRSAYSQDDEQSLALRLLNNNGGVLYTHTHTTRERENTTHKHTQITRRDATLAVLCLHFRRFGLFLFFGSFIFNDILLGQLTVFYLLSFG